MHPQDQLNNRDHQSDPARTPGDGWVDEGGASHLGPATHVDIDRERDAPATGGPAEGDIAAGE